MSMAKPKPREVAEKRDRAAHQKSAEPVDHWAFLDEFEAPMWADLNLEAATSCYKDNDDDWFHVSHPFHQCSSKKLISALTHAGGAKAHVGLGLKGESSPNLPPSVSKSRGKDYQNKNWSRGNLGIITNKQHPINNLNDKSLWANSGSSQKLKLKPSGDNRNETVASKATSVCKSSLTEITSLGSLNPNSNTEVSKATTSSSAITYESNERQQLKFSEVSNHIFGRTSGLLSSIKFTERKSIVPRQALRVESIGGRQSRGSKSSGKSSVGSSSHPYCDDGNAIHGPMLKNRDPTPESRNVNRMPLNKSKKSKIKSLDTRRGGKTVTKSAHKETAKSKVAQVVNSKVTRLHRGNELLGAVTNTNCKTEAKRHTNLVNGKENLKSCWTFAGGGDQKVKKPNATSKSDKPGFLGPKVKNCNRDEKKSSTTMNRIPFR